MKIRIVNGIAVVTSESIVISNVENTLDFIVNISYNNNCNKIILNKSAISEDFFKLSTGIAGEVTQKFVTYGVKLAIIGDFSHYASKALHDYIFECNKGNHLFFETDEQAAIERLNRYQ
jgi:hypothetical protein